MQSDPAVRVLLGLILLCLLILLVQGFSRDDSPFDAGWGRYQVTGMRAGAPVLIRTDTVTGQVWKLELRGGGNTWVAFHEPEKTGAREGAAPAQTSRERGEKPTETARVERDVVEPPGAPPLPEEPPRASPEVLEALPPAPEPQEEQEPLAVAEFVEALGNPALSTDMRVWVAAQLGEVEDPRAAEALLVAAADADPAVAEAARRALLGHDEARVRAAAEKAAESGTEEVRRAAEELLDASD